VVTSDVEQLFSSAAGRSLNPLFRLFLYTTDKLEIHVQQTAADKYIVRLLNIDMALPLEVITDEGLKKITVDKNGVTVNSKTFLQVDPRVFYRANRQSIIHIDAIQSIRPQDNQKLTITLKSAVKMEQDISREKAPAFKKWFER
jgi:hypothetical protein